MQFTNTINLQQFLQKQQGVLKGVGTPKRKSSAISVKKAQPGSATKIIVGKKHSARNLSQQPASGRGALNGVEEINKQQRDASL